MLAAAGRSMRTSTTPPLMAASSLGLGNSVLTCNEGVVDLSWRQEPGVGGGCQSGVCYNASRKSPGRSSACALRTIHECAPFTLRRKHCALSSTCLVNPQIYQPRLYHPKLTPQTTPLPPTLRIFPSGVRVESLLGEPYACRMRQPSSEARPRGLWISRVKSKTSGVTL